MAGAATAEERLPSGGNPFQEAVDRYDRWFDSPAGRKIFAVEAHAMRDLLEEMPRPWLEVGVGTGRFAQALGVDSGLDPSSEALKMADRRGIETCRGYGESLPLLNSSYGMVLIIVTICFLSEPAKAVREAWRVLRDDGRLLIGLVPGDSSWGQLYAAKARSGHLFYSAARFYTCKDTVKMAEDGGFVLETSRSCLFESPGENAGAYQTSRPGIIDGAGFVAMRFRKDM